jgi:hypothetical protein
MICKRYIAAFASHYEAAIAALDKGRCPPAVEEQDYLLVRLQSIGNSFG